jgi:hypothetical protein
MSDHLDTIETNLMKASGILHGLMYDSLQVDDPQARHNAAWAAQGLVDEASKALEAHMAELRKQRQPAGNVSNLPGCD